MISRFINQREDKITDSTPSHPQNTQICIEQQLLIHKISNIITQLTGKDGL